MEVVNKPQQNRFDQRPELKEMTALISGPFMFQAVVAGLKLKVFEVLVANPGGLTRQEVAAKIGIDEYPTRVLLNATCAAKATARDAEGRYSTTEVGKIFMSEEVSILGTSDILYHPMKFFTESLKQNRNVGVEVYPSPGATLYERMGQVPGLEALFHAWMRHTSVPIPTSFIADEVRSRKHVVDIGGGDAFNMVRLAKIATDTRFTVLDFPSVCERARARIKAEGLEGRVAAKEGNFLEEPLPTDADGFFIAHVFGIYAEETNKKLISRIFAALPAGGKLMSYEGLVSTDDETGPPLAASMSMYFLGLATGRGLVHSMKTMEGWAREAGFKRFTGYERTGFVAEK